MHIADGILPVVPAVVAHGVSVWIAHRTSRDVPPAEITRLGLLAAATFSVSLIHFPVAGTSVHLTLGGLVGIILGKRAYPVLFAALLLQAVLFQHGGVLALGVNTLNAGLGALVASMVWRSGIRAVAVRAGLAGFLSILVPALAVATEFALVGYGKGFYAIAGLYVVTGLIEGGLTVAMVQFFQRVKPEILATA